MPEDFLTPEQPKTVDVDRMRDLVRRRHMQFLLPFFLGWLIIWTASWFMPVRYKSTTTILVQQPSVPQNYVTPNISGNLQDRLASLTEQILSRTRLLTIANRLHLYGSPNTSIPSDDLVSRMRKDIKIALVRPNDSGPISGFTVSYSASSPLIAQNVARELTTLFIQNNQASLRQESESTTQFLQKQLTKARANLSEQETKVKQFEFDHQGALPAQQATNLQILAGLQAQLQHDQDSLNTARQQQIYLQSLIEQYNALYSSGQFSSATPADLATINTQLLNMKAQLADLRARYTDRYPAVQALQDKINAMVKERDHLVTAFQSGSTRSQQQHQIAGTSSALSAADTTSAVLQLKSQLDAAKTEIAVRRRDIEQLNGRINSYQARLNAEPVVAAELSSLTHAYEQSQTAYNSLLTKENNSAMATSMEQMQQAERFSVLDPPSLPIAPDSPNRQMLSLLGIACGLALGLIVAGGIEFLDDRLYNDKDIEDLLPVAVIGEIPEVATEAELRRTKWRLAVGWMVAVLVVLLILAGSALNYVGGPGSFSHLYNLHATHHV